MRLVLESELTQTEVTGTGSQLIHFQLMLVSDSEVGELAGLTLAVSIHKALRVQWPSAVAKLCR